MITLNNKTKEAFKSKFREIKGCVKVQFCGDEINKTSNKTMISGTKEAIISNSDSVFSSDPLYINYASLEFERFKLDGTFFLPNDPQKSNNYALEFNTNYLELPYDFNVKKGTLLLFEIEITEQKPMVFFQSEGDNIYLEFGINENERLYSKVVINEVENIEESDINFSDIKLNTRYRSYSEIYFTDQYSCLSICVGNISFATVFGNVSNNYILDGIQFGSLNSSGFNINEIAIYNKIDSLSYGESYSIYQNYLRSGKISSTNLISHYLFLDNEGIEIKDKINNKTAFVRGTPNYKLVPYINKNSGYIGGFNSDSITIIEKKNQSEDIGIAPVNKINGFTIYFQDGYAEDFDVKIKHATYGLKDCYLENISIRNNKESICFIEFNDVRDEYRQIAEMQIDILNWSNNHRIKIYKIDNGFTRLYDKQDLIDFEIIEQTDPIMLEIPNSAFTLNLNNYTGSFDEMNQKSIVPFLNKNTLILPYVWIKNTPEEIVPLGVFNYCGYDNNDTKVTLKGNGPFKGASSTNIQNGTYDAKEMLQDLAHTKITSCVSKNDFCYTNKVNNDYSNFENRDAQMQALAIFCNSMIYPERYYDVNLSIAPCSVACVPKYISSVLLLKHQKTFPKIINRNPIKNITFKNSMIANKETNLVELFKEKITGKKSENTMVYDYDLDIKLLRPIDFNSLQFYIDDEIVSENDLVSLKKNHHRIKFYYTSNKPDFTLTIKGYTYDENHIENTIEDFGVTEGDNILLNNPYIRKLEDMSRVANFIFQNYGTHLVEVEYIGDPSLQIADLIKLETKYGFKNIVITEHTLTYNGGLSGRIKGVIK